MNYNYDYRRNRIIEPAQLHSTEDVWSETSDQKFMLGCILDFNDGRRFRYCENGGTALTAAYMVQSEATTANWINKAVAPATAVGATSFTLASALNTTVAANDLDNGWLLITDAAGETHLYLIKSHTTGTTPTIYLADRGGIRVALTTSSGISLLKNAYKDVVVKVTAVDTTAMPARGVPLIDITANYYFWAQTRGPCPMVVDTGDTIVHGEPAGKPGTNAVAGAVGLVANDGTDPVYGVVMDDATAGETALIDLTLE